MISYRHTQPGRMMVASLGAVLIMEAAAMLYAGSVVGSVKGIGIFASVAMAAAMAIPGTTLVLAILFMFRSMTVHIHDGHLEWWFGSGFPRYSKSLSEIADVRIWPSRGFALGIHWTRDGWLYNVSGMKGVQVTLRNGKRFILGTDEPEALEAALAAALSQKEETA